MAEDSSASDCSWKKLVIAKANNEWISTIKTEQTDVDTSNYEHEENNDSDSSSPTPVSMLKVVHSVPDESGQRRRRKGQGPHFETPDERSMRLAKMSAYAAHRLANESSDQRAARLKRMSEYAARRLATETSEQRERRLARMSAYAARRLAEESPEQRAARLARMSAYAARRHAMRKTAPSVETNAANTTHYSQHHTHNSVTNQS